MEKAKKRMLTALCICVAFWLVLSTTLLIIQWRGNTKEPAMSVGGVLYRAQYTEDTTVVYADGKYYHVEASMLFGEMFSVDQWTQIEQAPTAKPTMAVSFAEQVYLLFYENGRVEAYNGYAARGQEKRTYYAVANTVNAEEQILAYVKQYGEEVDKFEAVRRDFDREF